LHQAISITKKQTQLPEVDLDKMEVTQFVDKGEDKSREKKDVLNQTNQSSNGNVTLNKSLFNDTTVALKIDNQETT